MQLLVSVALVEYAVAHSIIISYTGIETLHLRRKKTDEETPPVNNPIPDAYAHAKLETYVTGVLGGSASDYFFALRVSRQSESKFFTLKKKNLPPRRSMIRKVPPRRLLQP